jgi:predicted nucleic acid-binding protein
MKCFLDSSFIIALIMEKDDLHKKAIKLENKEKISENECYISNLVISEVITVIGNKTNKKN